jgi:transcriptional regulator of arginine metabolism
MRLNEAILRLLEDRDIDDQSQLLARLQGQGFDLTLSTLSRRMKKLGVRKVQGTYRAAVTPRSPFPPCTLVPVPGCILILKTEPGFAGAVAAALDAAGLPGLAGSVAGDDTVFVAPVDLALMDDLAARIRTWLG